MQAFLIRGQEVQSLEEMDAPGIDLPDSLIIPPGNYRVGNATFRLAEEGLYRFIQPMDGNNQRIVFTKDRYGLMSSICWLVSHGYRDNNKSFEEIEKIALHGKIILTCGNFCNFVLHLFKNLDVPARIVRGRTLHPPNGYNDGHVLMEVKLDGVWIVFDPDRGKMYCHNKKRLNLVELIEQIHSDSFEEESLTCGIPVAIGSFTTVHGNEYDLWMETWLAHSGSRRELLGRPLQIPIIPDAGMEYYTTIIDSHRERAEQLWSNENLIYLPLADFRKKFY